MHVFGDYSKDHKRCLTRPVVAGETRGNETEEERKKDKENSSFLVAPDGNLLAKCNPYVGTLFLD